ncbi:glycogen/starch synthase [Deinococcus deserti]|uniref:Glycogen synthase n=1 Tax=Deinococcus deserti (strain DSM 17065 / CIP 109153 / LMG 22923 / VCD115) TaxID=546414 RepID=GLGA_DEIDV|nr:glycogen/starch synthase [Deinococcus deserti]C1CWY8.1 RecName: Full=Glycogen synthase; AltName: Full=Starch [bacterial glycogen] synthase [Deinococcus deserti VCD115]ACO46705.1 putative starch synthase (glycogen synthase) [Deinococcus deserti VCD115]
MRVLHVTSEVFPFSRSGGLGDVLGALPAVQATLGAQVSVLSPWYGSLAGAPEQIWAGDVADVGPVRVGELRQDGVRFLFLGLPEFEREGLYHPDDVWRFCTYGRAVLPVLRALNEVPDVLHGHDWQAGLVVAHAHEAGWRTVYTVHNLQYQGRWNLAEASGWSGLGPAWLTHEGAEFYGDLNLMKAGLIAANHVTTVSPQYAREITTQQYGEGLQGVLLRLTLEGRLSGIINGLDQERWNPRTDPDVPAYSDLAGKAAATQALRTEFGLDKAPVLGVVSRLADQKGMDLLIEALPRLVHNWNVVVLGGGDPLLTAALEGWAQHPRVSFAQGMNEALAHQIYAGSDAFAMPSRFEPCGLSQMIAMRYGTLPVVRETGGLVDTVPPDVGFRFQPATPEALVEACQQARAAFEDQSDWEARVARAMALDFSWDGPAREYLALYERVVTG